MSKRISTSFNEAQIVLLNEILTKLLIGSDPKLLVRNKAFASLMGTVQSLKRRIDNPTQTRRPTAPPPAPEAPGQAAHESSSDIPRATYSGEAAQERAAET